MKALKPKTKPGQWHARRLALPLALLMLTACTPVKLSMKVDEPLKSGAQVYSLSYPDSLSDKVSGNSLNVLFGPYRVTDATLGWRGVNTRAEEPAPMFRIRDVKTDGNITTTTEVSGGPTELLGFSRPAEAGEPEIREEKQSASFQFHTGRDTTWNAQCTHRVTKRVIQLEQSNNTHTLSSDYRCEYRKAVASTSSEAWILTVENDGTITMVQTGKAGELFAHEKSGVYVTPDGKVAKSTRKTAGYIWSQGDAGKSPPVGAVSIEGESPRVWLHKANSQELNEIIAMANSGLIVYRWGMLQ